MIHVFNRSSRYGGGCYFLFDISKKFIDAVDMCFENGLLPVDIENENENADIFAAVSAAVDRALLNPPNWHDW